MRLTLPSRWLPRPPNPAATARVFLIPYSGCGASMYRQWPATYRGADFIPVELPGHETRFSEPNFETYQSLAEQLIPALRPHLDVPFAFFGHCGSALAAYEASVYCLTSGAPTPADLFLSSQVAPQDGPAGRFLSMSAEELARELETLIAETGGTPSPSLIDLYLEVLCADIETNKRYHVADPVRLPCRITPVGWDEDHEIPHQTMGGWSACGDAKPVLLPGGHHRFIEAPVELLDIMVDRLQEVRS